MATRTFSVAGNAIVGGNLLAAGHNILGGWQYNVAATTAVTTHSVAVKKTTASSALDVEGTALISGAVEVGVLKANVLNLSALATAPSSTASTLWRDSVGALMFAGEEVVTDGFVFASSQIPALTSDKITGVLGSSSLPTVRGPTVTSGTLTLTQIGTPAATQFVDALTVSQIPSVAASKLTAGTLHINRIPSLDASVFTSGALAVSRGGTGLSTVPAQSVLLGNGTSALTASTALRVSSNGVNTSINTATVNRPFRVNGGVRVDSGVYVDSTAQPVSAALTITSKAAGFHIVAETTAINAAAQFTVTWTTSGVHGSLTVGVGVYHGTLDLASVVPLSKTQYGQSAGVVSVGVYSVSATVKRFVVQTERTMNICCYMDNNYSGRWKLVNYTSIGQPSYRSRLFVNIPTALTNANNQARFAAVGQYCYMICPGRNGTIEPNSLLAGNTLMYAGFSIHYRTTQPIHSRTGTPSGVWRAMGHTWGDANAWFAATLMLRVM